VRLNVASIDARLEEHAAAIELAQQVLKLPAIQLDKNYGSWIEATSDATRVYALAGRADLAIPLLEKLLAAPGAGSGVSYSELRLDPEFDPIRGDPAFQALVNAHPGSGDVRE
jgi:hypothetical protein